MNSTFYCPAPLVYAHSNHDTVLWAYEPGDCAIPCPTLTYSSEEWTFLTHTVLILSALSLCCTATALAILSADFKKLFLRAMFILGFLVSAVVSLIFFIENRNDMVVCNGDAHYVKRDGLCIFQAATVVFLFLWVEIWSVILSIDTYLHIISRMPKDKIDALRGRYMAVALVFCTVMTSIPLIGDNLGFDPQANIPFCLYLFSDNQWYFWYTLFAPFCILNFICLVITLAGAARIHSVFVSTKKFATAPHGTHAQSSMAPGQELNSSCPSEREVMGDDTNRSSIVSSEYSQSEDSPYSPSSTPVFLSLDPCLYGGSMIKEPLVRDSEDSAADVPMHVGQWADARDGLYEDSSVGDWRGSNMSWGISSPSLQSKQDLLGATKAKKTTDSSDSPPFTSSITTMPWSSSADLSTTNQDSRNHAARLSWLSSLNKSILRKGTVNLAMLKESLRYNGRSILFVVVFCMTTMYVAPSLLYINGIKYDHFVDGTEDFAACLVEAAFESPDQSQKGVDDYAKQQCGTVPSVRASKLQFFSTMMWAFGYGIVPSIIFGFSGLSVRNFLTRILSFFKGFREEGKS